MKTYELAEFLTEGIPLISGIAVFAVLYYYKFLLPVYKLIGIYLFISFITDQMGIVVARFFNNNLILIIVFALLELLIYSCIYLVISGRKLFLIISTSLACCFIFFEILYTNPADSENFQPYARVVSSFFIVLFALNYFYETIAYTHHHSQQSYLNLNTLILIFYVLNFIYFLPINFLIDESSNTPFFFWIGNCSLTLLFYSLLTVLLCIHGKRQKQLRYG